MSISVTIPNAQQLYALMKAQPVDDRIFGATLTKSTLTGELTRTDSAVGLTASVSLDLTAGASDFDNMPIWGEITESTDYYGNTFVRIPKCYVRLNEDTTTKSWQVSKKRHSGFFLPWCFWDFTNGVELDYVDIGKYPATLSGASKLESKAGVYPLVLTTIVDFRTYAEANNTVSLLGYQLLDIHAIELLRTLFFIEYANLGIQSVMAGYTTGQYSASHTLTADTDPAGNTLVVANATGALYAVGQAISVGTVLGGVQRFYGRTITNIQADIPGAGSTTITFDGDAVALTTGDILYNSGWKNGFSINVAGHTGSIGSNSTGKYPCVYRGIENLFGNVFQFVDGVNISDYQAWIALNADDYASNVFASPYVQLGYVNASSNNYVATMGRDNVYPFAQFPATVADANSSPYRDFYYGAAGARVAQFGGRWANGASAGLSYWILSDSSAISSVSLGSRLLKKAL